MYSEPSSNSLRDHSSIVRDAYTLLPLNTLNSTINMDVKRVSTQIKTLGGRCDGVVHAMKFQQHVTKTPFHWINFNS